MIPNETADGAILSAKLNAVLTAFASSNTDEKCDMWFTRLLPQLPLLLMLGCAETPEQPAPLPPTQVDLKIESAPMINPDTDGKAAPVLLRVYELREQSSFNGADFFALFDKEQATLAADLVRKQELLIKPGENKAIHIEPAADTRSLGFFAAFRKLDNAQWRAVAPVVAHQNNTVTLKIKGNTLAADASAEPPPALAVKPAD